jgi:2'-5' RNA ligase
LNNDTNYALVIFLPQALEMLVQKWREQYDPDYNLIRAHITLVFPFSTEKSLDILVRAIQTVLKDVKPFKVELKSIGDFYPKVPVIYWQVKTNPKINELYKSLYTVLDIPLPFKEIIPHVTVAKEISHHRVMLVKEKLVDYLPDETFQVDTIDLVSPLANHHWVSVRTFNLLK